MDIVAHGGKYLLQYCTDQKSDGQHCRNVLHYNCLLYYVATVEETVIIPGNFDCVDRNGNISYFTLYRIRYTSRRGE